MTALTAAGARAQVRDRPVAPASVGVVAGRVVFIDRNGTTPVRRAHIVATPGSGAAVSADADTDGRFRIDRVPAGPVRVRVDKPGFVLESAAPAHVSGEDVTFDLGASQTATLDLRMQRGAALEGRVLRQSGEPLQNVAVAAVRATGAAGGDSTDVRETRTDDLGRYRLHSLRPGRYLVAVTADTAPGRGPAAAAAQTFFPGTTQPGDAQVLEVAVGQERSGLDFAAMAMPMSSDAVQGVSPGPSAEPGSIGLVGRIEGRVTTADSGRALENAQVLLLPVGIAGPTPRERTDADGHFAFEHLGAGAYRVRVTADGYLQWEYGEQLPTAPGKPVELGDGEAFTQANVALPRPSAVEGVLTDEFGDPAPGVRVQVARVDFVAGRTRLMPVGSTANMRATDDRGWYRVFGLPPGQYYVMALSGPFADEDWAGFAPSFYPGTPAAADARGVRLEVGSGAPDISFQLTPTATGTVSGIAVTGSGDPAGRTGIVLFQLQGGDVRAAISARAVTAADGTFAVRNVPFGTYVVQAYAGRSDFGSAPVTVGPDPTPPARLVVTSGVTVRGRITFNGTTPHPAADKVRVLHRPVDFVSGPVVGRGLPASAISPDWTFEVSGLNGLGVLSAMVPQPWAVERITLAGRDVTDAPLDFRRVDVTGVEIELTDRFGGVTGSVEDQGQPVTDYSAVLFAKDAGRWTFPSRFVLLARPNQTGAFQFTGVAPGDYLIVALPLLQGAEWQDPAFLEQMRALATPVTVVEGLPARVQVRIVR